MLSLRALLALAGLATSQAVHYFKGLSSIHDLEMLKMIAENGASSGGDRVRAILCG